MDFRCEHETFPEDLDDGSNEVAGVHADEGNKQKVERVAHVLPEKTKVRS